IKLFTMTVLVAIALVSFALAAYAATANAGVDVASVTVPEQYGSVAEVYTDGTNGKTIIHIQDAHVNYEAQKNLAGLVEHLIKNYGVKLILVEGGSRNDSLSYLREKAPVETRELVAEEFLRAGRITGEEYLDIVSDYPMLLWGVEDKPLYDEGMRAFLEVDTFKDEAVEKVNAIRKAANSLKSRIYNKEMKELDSKERAFEDKRLSLAAYYEYLGNVASEKGIDISAYPNVSRFTQLVKLEKAIDFGAVEKERAGLIDALSKLLAEGDAAALTGKASDYKEGKITASAFHNYLADLAQSNGTDNAQYPNFTSYVEYLKIYTGINSDNLFAEGQEYVEAIKDKLIITDEERTLAKISKGADILKDIFAIRLTPEEFDYFKRHKDQFITAGWSKFLTEEKLTYQVEGEIPLDLSAIDDNMDKIERFYDIANQRDEVFIRNTAMRMDEQGVDTAILITGGFHTPRLTQNFKREGYTYMVIAPTVSRETDSALYHEMLKKKWNPSE
ncbi:MAG: hypothetical protein HY589_05465, partial [Candidatus Omnitrophica bacterium]|nr:hypothetical protein [Candidatus Omnitrophota bacterium]